MSRRFPPRIRAVARWLLLLAATVATWAPILWLEALASPSIPGALRHAEFLAAGGGAIPAEEDGWSPVSLPDDWRRRRPGVREGWYRIAFRLEPDGEPRSALFLPVVMMNAAVYLNGELVGDGGRFEEPVARNLNRPLLFPLPPAELAPGDNTLHVRVKADVEDGGFLPALHVGSFRELEPFYYRADFIRETLIWILIVYRLVLATFTAAIWAMWRKEGYYGWFTLCAVAWCLAEANLIVVEPPVSTAVWYWLFNVAIGWWGIFAVRLVLSFIGGSNPRAERALMVCGAVGSIILGILAVTDSPYFIPLGVNLWLTLAFVGSCTMFRGVVPRLRRHPDQIELNVVFVVALSVIGCVLYDLVMQLGLRPRGGISAPVYGSLVAVGGMGWVLVRRFVGALRESRALVMTLESRVREKHAELEASYRRIGEVDRARTLSEERERIMSDMNDGLGAHLVSTLAMVERPDARAEELQQSVRAALDDLRLMIDSLDPSEG
ncbi:MAG: hypothetical protein ACREQQ_06760, partial [Candidatus Binatia bacterium]